jgi:hypothetical protein
MMPTIKLLRSVLGRVVSRGSSGFAQVLEGAQPVRESVRTMASNACTAGNLAVLVVAGLLTALGLVILTSDPIEVHAAAVPAVTESHAGPGLDDSKAAVALMATAGLSAGAGGLGPAGSISAVPPTNSALPAQVHRVQSSLDEGGVLFDDGVRPHEPGGPAIGAAQETSAIE